MDEDDGDFPSGPWIGFYLYEAAGVKHRQELSLRFSDGRLTGDGCDGVGAFFIHGQYSTETREVRWVKNYPGSHNVHYRGFREGKGIWGTWEVGAQARGGFKIWPKALGDADGEIDSAEAEVPEEAVRVIAVAGGSPGQGL